MTGTYQTLTFKEEDGIAWIRLNRPEEFNALSLTMTQELCKVAAFCSARKTVRAVVLTGTGKAFCAGGDVKEMTEKSVGKERPDLFLRELAANLHIFISEISRMPKPIVAAVNGVAAGAGFSMSLACDLALASKSARFVMAYTGIGLSPDGGSTFWLNQLVGPRKAMEMIYFNEPIDADEALRLGLVNRVVASEQLEEEVKLLAQKLVQGPRKTFGRAKKLVRSASTETLESQMELERQEIALSTLETEFQEGVTAFVEKRPPDFRKL